MVSKSGLGPLLLIAVLAAATPGSAVSEEFRFAAVADTAYNMPEDRPYYEALIRSINRLQPAFTIHLGDIQGGRTPCTEEILQLNAAFFETYDHPVVYTPGDNEWTDCHRTGGDPLTRLARVREVFFAAAGAAAMEAPATGALGGGTLRTLRQSATDGFETYVENAMWERGEVLFATVHMVGSNNNRRRRPRSAMTEYRMRDAANRAWIRTAFQRAAQSGSRAVVLGFHGDPFLEQKPASSGYFDTLSAIRRGAATFPGQVLLIHADSHEFIIDRPFTRQPSAREPTLGNVTRLQVFGAPELKAVEVTVDPESPTVFGFRAIVGDQASGR